MSHNSPNVSAVDAIGTLLAKRRRAAGGGGLCVRGVTRRLLTACGCGRWRRIVLREMMSVGGACD
jgi:hypothetical protein